MVRNLYKHRVFLIIIQVIFSIIFGYAFGTATMFILILLGVGFLFERISGCPGSIFVKHIPDTCNVDLDNQLYTLIQIIFGVYGFAVAYKNMKLFKTLK
jgi:hypothetical protein